MSLPLIHELVTRSARRFGDRPAVVDGDRSVTYSELDRRSNQLAWLLAARGVRSGDRVGLFLEKSLEAVVGIYGVLKAGATYVPLDEQAPARRLAYIARDAGIRCLLSSPARSAGVQALVQEGARFTSVVGSPELPWSEVEEWSDEAPVLDIGSDSLAYILYTSGSTGEPKGVMLSHENGMAFVDWAAREVGATSEDRFSSHAPFHFDLSTFDLYAAAWAGAAVVLVPRETSIFPIEVTRWIAEQEISVWYSVPSALTQLVLHGRLEDVALDRLRVIVFAGEVFPTKYLGALMHSVPGARYFNFYGPTETNVCTWYEVPGDRPLPPESLPIGKPLPCVTATVEGEDGQPVPVGEVGELVITGPTVMHGYRGDPERTARVLEVRADASRTYRTGDLVRVDEEGDLLYLGRRDAQIKTRGYRVELGEIEAALNALDVVVEAAVVAIPDDAVTNRLKAFVVLAREVPEGELARRCRERLPHYMIPGEFELREELPKSSTGKVDRRALQI
ncbi:MAG TPA: amino acid adenylation domain-containing protein [Solirubrobacteraceae bacterium]|nr:amino acid adenylation domain-containing protein [Solirubrobacteraceae bacterium]